MAARAYREESIVSANMLAGMVPVNALFVNILIASRMTQMSRDARMKIAGHPQAGRRRRGMAARAYRASRLISVEMPVGTVPVNALFINILITHPNRKCRET
jgi:hypothetical protein